MNEQPTANLVVFCASLPLAMTRAIPMRNGFLQWPQRLPITTSWIRSSNRSGRISSKLGQGTFVLDEDRCHPALLQMIQHCHQQKYRFAIFPLAANAVSLSPACQDMQAWLAERGRAFRWTNLPASERGK